MQDLSCVRREENYNCHWKGKWEGRRPKNGGKIRDIWGQQ